MSPIAPLLLTGSEFGPDATIVLPPHTAQPPAFLAPQADNREPEFKAAEQRENVYAGMHEREWNGTPLLPWSRERDSLLARLVELDLLGGTLKELQRIKAAYDAVKLQDPNVSPLGEIIDFGLYLPVASKLLWLASHDAAVIMPLRNRPDKFIAEIERWAVASIPDEDAERACFLAAQIQEEWKQFRPLYRPSSRRGREAPGN